MKWNKERGDEKVNEFTMARFQTGGDITIGKLPLVIVGKIPLVTAKKVPPVLVDHCSDKYVDKIRVQSMSIFR